MCVLPRGGMVVVVCNIALCAGGGGFCNKVSGRGEENDFRQCMCGRAPPPDTPQNSWSHSGGGCACVDSRGIFCGVRAFSSEVSQWPRNLKAHTACRQCTVHTTQRPHELHSTASRWVGMGTGASVQGHGQPWWGSARAVQEALEGGTWRQLLEQQKADVNAADPHNGRTLLHEVLQPGCRGVAGAAEAAEFLVGSGAASVPDGEGRTPVWYALQLCEGDTRSALLAALGEHVKEMQRGVASRLRHFLTDEWPCLRTRVATDDAAAGTAPEAPQQQQPQAQPVPQEPDTHKPTDKDKTSESLQNYVDGRKICFTRNDAVCNTPLLEWLVQLLVVQPDLGYRAGHVDSMLLGLRFVVQRVLRGVEAAPDAIEDWMAVDDWFEHLCAGYLFTTDCTEYQIDAATGELVCNADGAPIIKDYHKTFTDENVLANHGAKYVRPALYFGMNQAMRTIGLSEGVRQSAADSVFELEPSPAQLHVIATFQPLIAKLTRLIRSRRPRLTTVFRGIDVNVSARYKVGTSVVWNAFTSTTQKQDVAKSFLYGKAGTFFVIVAKQGAAEVGFASVFPQEAELLYDSNIEFRVQWKLSPTLLRMVGQPFDVIVMQEVAGHDDPSTAALSQQAQAHSQSRTAAYAVADQVEAVRQVLQHTASLFAEFLEGYVEGRVGDDTHVPEAETRKLLREVDKWLAADRHGEKGARPPRRPLCLVGDGGTGKTSAAVAVLCHLLQEKKAGGVASQRRKNLAPGPSSAGPPTGKFKKGKKPVFPVFLALPAIGAATVTTRGGIDEFIRKSFGLEEAALEHLSSEYDVVVILDSLDEVGLTQAGMGSAYNDSGGQGVLQLHPWCAKRCSVIVTTRGEYLKSVGHTASQVCGDQTRSLYMQPFTQSDAATYITKVRAAQVAKAEKQRVDVCFTADEQRQLADTVREICSAPDTTAQHRDRALVMAMVERAWVLAGGDGGNNSGMAASTHTSGQAEGEIASPSNGVLPHDSGCVQAAADAVLLALEGRGGGTSHAASASVPLHDVLVALSQQAAFLERRKAALRRAAKSTAQLDQLAADPVSPHSVADAEVAVLSQLRNLFLLHMACYARRDLTSCSAQCLSDVAVSEAYLQKHVEMGLGQGTPGAASGHTAGELTQAIAARVEGVLRVGELIACAMLQAQTWQGVLGTERARLLEQDNVCNAEADEAFRLMPFRVESFEDDRSAFAFRHKTLGEFLVARRLSRKGGVADTLRCKVRRAFSQDAPNVLQYFSDTLIAGGGEARNTKVAAELLPLVRESRVARGGDTTSRAAASNAMALAARAGYVFNCDLAGVLVQDSDLRHARLCRTALRGARFYNCWLEHAIFTDVDLTRSDWEGCSFGAPLPPLLGHTSDVYHVTVTPDGAKIISASEDKTIRVWDASTGSELQVLEGHTERAKSVTVTPDGSKIISASGDKTIRVWDASTGKELHILEGHTGSVHSVAVTPDGSKIISASGDRTVRVWDATTGEVVKRLTAHTGEVRSVTVTPDGAKIVSASEDKSVRVWDASTGKVLQKLEGHVEQVLSVTVTPDGSKIISASRDKTIRVWDASTGKVLQKLKGHTDCVHSVTVTPDGSKFISASGDKTIRVWDASTGKVLQKLEGHTGSIHGVTVTRYGTKIVSSSADSTVRVWDALTGKELPKLEGHTDCVQSVAVTPDGSQIISASTDGTVRVWEASTGKHLQKLEGQTGPIHSVTVTPDGVNIIAGSWDTVRVWEASTGTALQRLGGHPVCGECVTVTPDGAKIISGADNKTVGVWSASTVKQLQKLEGHTSYIRSVTVTPDGAKIISASDDKTIRVWDAATGKELLKLEGHTDCVQSVTVTPDGTKIISGSRDKTVRVWNASTGTMLQKLKGHTGSIESVAVTPDGSG